MGGLVLEVLGKIPKEGESFVWNNFKIEVIDLDGAKIDKLLITALQDTDTEASGVWNNINPFAWQKRL